MISSVKFIVLNHNCVYQPSCLLRDIHVQEELPLRLQKTHLRVFQLGEESVFHQYRGQSTPDACFNLNVFHSSSYEICMCMYIATGTFYFVYCDYLQFVFNSTLTSLTGHDLCCFCALLCMKL